MTVSNIGIASILSDPFGKTASQIISYLFEHTADAFNEKACRKRIKKKANAKSDEIIAAIQGYHIESDQQLKFELARGHFDYLEGMITKTEVELYVRIKPHWHLVELISALPGITEISATLIFAEIGVDMTAFEGEKHLTSWSSLAPANNESAGKKKSTRIAKAGQYLKPLLVQCALATNQSKKEPYFAITYQHIKKRCGHKKAVTAIARMMLVCIYYMVLEEKPFKPTDYTELMDPHFRNDKIVLNDKNVFSYLVQQGYDISTLQKCNDN